MSPVALERGLVGRRARDGITRRDRRAGPGGGGGQVAVCDEQRVAAGVELPVAMTGAGSGCISVGGEPTLDALLSGVWEGLAAHCAVACPICAGELQPEYGAHALPIGGRCVECGTRLN